MGWARRGEGGTRPFFPSSTRVPSIRVPSSLLLFANRRRDASAAIPSSIRVPSIRVPSSIREGTRIEGGTRPLLFLAALRPRPTVYGPRARRVAVAVAQPSGGDGRRHRETDIDARSLLDRGACSFVHDI